MPHVEPREMDFREEIRRKLEYAMGRQGLKTQKQAAEQLGVSPARFNLYLKKKATPSAFFLMTACKLWRLNIEFDGIEFKSKKLSDKQKASRSSPEQLPLFSALRELENQNLGVRIEKKALDRLALSVEIRFAG